MSAPQSKQKGDALSIAFVRLHVVSLVGSKAYRAGSGLNSGPAFFVSAETTRP
jgi:hypothetical protein